VGIGGLETDQDLQCSIETFRFELSSTIAISALAWSEFSMALSMTICGIFFDEVFEIFLTVSFLGAVFLSLAFGLAIVFN
jgi:hypothetical protein